MPWRTHSTGLLRGGAGLDRHAERRSDPGLLAALATAPETIALRIRGDRTDVLEDGDRIRLDLRALAAGDEPLAYLGDRADGSSVVLLAAPADEMRVGRTLRAVGAHLDEADGTLLATGLGLANWHATHTHCPRCGTPTEVHAAGWSRRCPADESLHFPRTDPAVIMAVVDGADRLLLARGRGFTTTGMSVLAGFVEPGESFAAAVAREVEEEVGLRVTDVEYLGDQPWPFPSSLMVGFLARAADGALRMQEDEIEAARWFTREELAAQVAAEQVHISGRLSIARHLIEHWYGGPLDAPEAMLRPPRDT
jgi:NAD+ diphosphatase